MSKINILDHGYVQFIEHWGSDESIIEAARMSTGKGFQGWGPIRTNEPCENCAGEGSYVFDPADIEPPIMFPAPPSVRRCGKCEGTGRNKVPGDEKLLAYLYKNQHMTPFEMGGLVIEVQAPIFVFREWHRHRTQSYNEMSARYTPLPDVNYMPTMDRLMINAGTSNKQAGTVKDAEELTVGSAERFQASLRETYKEAEELYQWALARGVPKELARIHLPVGRYSRMRASANLRNWLGFLTLRQAAGAQWEIRAYANAVATLVESKFPRTYELFAGGRG